MKPAGPASKSPGKLQPAGSVQRFTCSHLLGGRFSAAGAPARSLKGSLFHWQVVFVQSPLPSVLGAVFFCVGVWMDVSLATWS